MVFNHSVKVPRKYKLSANILKQVYEGANLKSLLFQEKYRHWPVDAIYALILETLKHEVFLNKLFSELRIIENERRLDPWLAKVLMVELLFGRKELLQGSKPVETVLSYFDKAKNLFAEFNVDVEESKNQVLKPRYVRINTLKIATADAIRAFQDLGWKFIRCTSGSYDDYLKQLKNLTTDDFIQDYHVKTVFAFAPKTQLQKEQLYLEKNIFLQDKATSLAAKFLAPLPGSAVLDMCAAPGMKTTHLAALIKNEGTIYAVEKDINRYKILCEFVKEAGASCVKPINEDAFKLNKEMLPNVEYILVDPSCSGSGMDRPEFVHDSEKDLRVRLKKLSSMQAKLLKHAIFAFPNTKRIVYSTCSLYPEENEEVVRELASHRKSKFKLVSAKTILKDNWNNVGDLHYHDVGEKCLYAKPNSDLTTGVFIAIFEKVHQGEGVRNAEDIVRINENSSEVILKTKLKTKSLYIDENTQEERDNILAHVDDSFKEYQGKCKKKEGNNQDFVETYSYETHRMESTRNSKKLAKHSKDKVIMTEIEAHGNMPNITNENENVSSHVDEIINFEKKTKKTKKSRRIILDSPKEHESDGDINISEEKKNYKKVKKSNMNKSVGNRNIEIFSAENENAEITKMEIFEDLNENMSTHIDEIIDFEHKTKKSKKSRRKTSDKLNKHEIGSCEDNYSNILISSNDKTNNKKKGKKSKREMRNVDIFSKENENDFSFDEAINFEIKIKKAKKSKRKHPNDPTDGELSSCNNSSNVLLSINNETKKHKKEKKSKENKFSLPQDDRDSFSNNGDAINSNYVEYIDNDTNRIKPEKRLKRKKSDVSTNSDTLVSSYDVETQHFFENKKSKIRKHSQVLTNSIRETEEVESERYNHKKGKKTCDTNKNFDSNILGNEDSDTEKEKHKLKKSKQKKLKRELAIQDNTEENLQNSKDSFDYDPENFNSDIRKKKSKKSKIQLLQDDA